MNYRRNTITCMIVILLVGLCVINWPGRILASKPARIAIVPFKMTGDTNLSFLHQAVTDMLTSRLSNPGQSVVIPKEETQTIFNGAAEIIVDEKFANVLASQLNADYVLFGSLNVSGDRVGIKAKMLDLSGRQSPMTFFTQSQGMEEFIPKIDEIAGQINQEVFGQQVSKKAQEIQPPENKPSLYAHPERLWEKELSRSSVNSDTRSKMMFQPSVGMITGFQKSRDLGFEVEGIAAGDLDGNFLNEMVLMTSGKIHIFKNLPGHMHKLAEYEAGEHQRFISVDVADINKNGRSEIFVTCLNQNTQAIESFAVEWNGSDFVTVSNNMGWYLRVLKNPERGRVLCGQKKGDDTLFTKGVYHLIWDGQTYTEQKKLPVPSNVIIYGFAVGNIINENSNSIAFLDINRKIRLSTVDGKIKWESNHTYGGDERALLTLFDENNESEIFWPHHLLLKDTNGDGKSEVIVVKNNAPEGFFLKKIRDNSSGRIEALSWNGFGLSPAWRTRDIDGYISDYILVDLNNDDDTELVVSIVNRRDTLFRSPKSTVIVYELGTQRTPQ